MTRPAIRRFAILAAILASCSAPLAAQEAGDSLQHCSVNADVSDAALAARYAPVLRFSPGEPYFPTIPYFYAFDGVDNNHNGLVDFDDPEEIAAFQPGDTLMPSWSILDDRYTALQTALSPRNGTPVAPMPAVFYRVRSLTDAEENAMSSALKKDILAWDRASRTRIGTLDLLDAPFKVIEYFFYYVRDKGLVGHPQDIEFAFVFVPEDPELACIARVVVGAGHTSWVPNNILVVSNDLVMGNLGPSSLDTLTGIMTELGGHSSAPDVPPYGVFRLGMDVNWQATKAWGVRDIQALAQMGYGGQYQPDMTLPRDSSMNKSVVFWPRGTTHGYGQDYSLVPAPLFAQLYGVLDTIAEGMPHGKWPKRVDEIRGYLDSIAVLMNLPPIAGVATLDSAKVARMTAWTRPTIAPKIPGGGEVSAARHQPWLHPEYENSPSDIFKSHLYAPSMKSIERPTDILRYVTWGATAWPGNGGQVQVGFVVPWVKLPIEPRGFFTVDLGFIGSSDLTDGGISLGLSYFSSYFQRMSWYTAVNYIPDASITGSHFTVVVGPSALLWRSIHKSLLGPVNALRLSTGPRFRLSGPSYNAGVDWEFRLTFRQ